MNVSQGDFVLTSSGCAARVERINLVNGVPFYLGALVCFTAWGPVVTRQTNLFAAGEIVAVKQTASASEETNAA